MSGDSGDLLPDALQPAHEARAALVASLLESPDERIDEGAEEEWQATIQRRMAEMDFGTVRTISWTYIRARVDQCTRQRKD